MTEEIAVSLFTVITTHCSFFLSLQSRNADEKAKHERREKITRNRLSRSGMQIDSSTDLLSTKANCSLLPPPPLLSVQQQPSSVKSKPESIEVLNPFLSSGADATIIDTGTESSHSITETFDRILSPATACTGLPLNEPNNTDHWRTLFDSSVSSCLVSRLT